MGQKKRKHTFLTQPVRGVGVGTYHVPGTNENVYIQYHQQSITYMHHFVSPHRSESTEEQFTPRVKVRRPCPAYNKKGTNFHQPKPAGRGRVSRSHLPATLPKRPRETLNYLRVIARDWAIPLSSTQAAFLVRRFHKKAIVQSLNRFLNHKISNRVLYRPVGRATTIGTSEHDQRRPQRQQSTPRGGRKEAALRAAAGHAS